MASLSKAGWHIEVWDILCPNCTDKFWAVDRTKADFLKGILCSHCREKLQKYYPEIKL